MHESYFIEGAVDTDLVVAFGRRLESGLGVLRAPAATGSFRLRLSDRSPGPGYRMRIDASGAEISAATKADLFYACGEYLRLCLPGGRLFRESLLVERAPAVPWRVIYAPGHFRNGYESASPEEMRELITEAAFWGANVWGDWFDPAEGARPYGSERSDGEMSKWYFGHKKEVLTAAQEVGMKIMLCLTPNHVFMDQLDPELIALRKAPSGAQRVGKSAVYGNLLCPSQPKARKIILDNHLELFQDLAGSGISPDFGCAFFYDNGGCMCDACDPWVSTALDLQAEVAAIAREYFPKMELTLCGWYLAPRELELIQRRHANGEIPWATGLQIALSGGSRDVRPMAAIESMGKDLFVNLGYSANNIDDVYGLCGAVMAPERIGAIAADAVAGGCRMFIGYGEGIHDDLNKCLATKLTWDGEARPADVLLSYARWYYGLAGGDAEECAAILAQLEHTAYTSRTDLEARLARVAERMGGEARLSWRFRHLEYRLALCALDSLLGRTADWERGLAEATRSEVDGDACRSRILAYLEARRSLMVERDRVFRDLNRSVYGLPGLFDFFNYHKRKALHSWIARIRAAMEALPAGSSTKLILASLAKEGVTGVRTID